MSYFETYFQMPEPGALLKMMTENIKETLASKREN